MPTSNETTLQAIMQGLRNKQFDMRVHNLAVEIGAARAGDKAAAIGSFQNMVEGCYGGY